MRKIKFTKKMAVIGIALGMILILCIVLATRMSAMRKTGRSVSLNQSAKARKGTISSVVSGTGNLEMNEYVDVTVPTGIVVKEVMVEPGDVVKKDQVLAKLDSASIAGELLDVREKKEDLEDQLDESDLSDLEVEKLTGEKSDVVEAIEMLEKLHNKPEITASSAGVIGEVYLSENTETSKNAASTSSPAAADNNIPTTNTEGNLTGVSVKNDISSGASHYGHSAVSQRIENETEGAGGTVITLAMKQYHGNQNKNISGNIKMMSAVSMSGEGKMLRASSDSVEEKEGETVSADTEADVVASNTEEDDPKPVEPTVITDYSNLVVKAPVKGESPQSEISETDYYTGQITWNCTDKMFMPDTIYTATIILNAKDGYTFMSSNLPSIPGSYYDWRVLNEGENGNKLRITAAYQKTASETKNPDGTQSKPDQDNKPTEGDSSAPGDKNGQNGNGNNQNPSGNGQNQSGNNQSQMGNGQNSSGTSSSGSKTGNISSGTVASASSSGTNTVSGNISGENAAAAYSSYETMAFTIQRQDKVRIYVSVDEMDILDILVGQQAAVTLDAFGNNEFSGEITKIASEPVTGSGSTKYTVEISMEKEENMMNGMSASVSIVTGNVENAVMIPIDALQETGNKVFVYTGEDEGKNLTGEVEVETGISDSAYVEIKKGLEEGNIVYYVRTESSDTDGFMGMPGGGMGGPMGQGMPGQEE